MFYKKRLSDVLRLQNIVSGFASPLSQWIYGMAKYDTQCRSHILQ